MLIILLATLFVTVLIFAIKRNLTYLHIFQQQEYYNYRFLSWIFANKAFDKRLSSLLLIIFLIINQFIINNFFIIIALCLIFLIFSYIEKNPIKQAKKKLVFTNRAKRIYYLSLIINILTNIVLFINLKYLNLFVVLLLNIHLIPAYLILANLLLIPIENKIQKNFLNLAKQVLSTFKPFIIGITGSFGKTSVKHFLGHILQHVDHTLITPGSINTPMGISRIIREQLNAAHRYFIVEMGAYGLGSIKRICELTNPNMGIIISIGNAHYERFKSLEIVANTKFELADSVINNNVNAKVIISDQTLNTNYAKQYIKDHSNNFEILNTQLINITQLKTGLSITLTWQNSTYTIETPIFGKHHANNIALAFISACNLGIPPATIITALKSMPQINHRLEVIKHDNYTIIDDAYNSNPTGFKAALELLNFLHERPGRRILVTPGLIELGTAHTKEHLILGQAAANATDIAIIINPKRIPSFVNGFKEQANNTQELITLSCFKEAKAWLDKNCRTKDTVLLANDLPDLYETGLKL
jgi:UDP-N-acetylmuramoyl-tripeptide--D-alanyl-D-alanine ligase